MIAGLHVERLVVAFKEQFRFTLQHDDPLILILIVPEAFGAGLAGGNDPLDTDVLVFDQRHDEFIWEIRWQTGEKVRY